MTNDLEMMKAMASLFRKKAAVMEALEGGMAKDGTNEHFKYKFMSASSIKHTVGRLFAANGIALKMSGISTENAVSTVTSSKGDTKNVPILRIQFSICLCDVDTGAVDESFWFGEAGATDDKAASKAATSALKYFLISNLLIADKEEDARDTDRDNRKKSQSQSTPRPTENTPAKPQAPVWWDILKEVKPKLAAADFDALVADLKAGLYEGRISATMADAHVRAMLFEEFAVDIRKENA